MTQKLRFSVWFSIIILAAFAVGYWTWSGVNWNWPEYSWNLGKSPLSVVEGWKTYRNEEYGFEFKYPPGWEVLRNSAGINVSIRDKKYGGSFEWPGLRIDDRDVIGEFKTSRMGSEFGNSDIKDDVARLKFVADSRVLYASCALYFNSDLISTCNQILSTFKFIE